MKAFPCEATDKRGATVSATISSSMAACAGPENLLPALRISVIRDSVRINDVKTIAVGKSHLDLIAPLLEPAEKTVNCVQTAYPNTYVLWCDPTNCTAG
jgi:hypothetical protein